MWKNTYIITFIILLLLYYFLSETSKIATKLEKVVLQDIYAIYQQMKS